jgi:4-hydroxythreonine-4-phosphate dehydrogenase
VYVPRIIVTSGEPAGIGPDICVTLARSDWRAAMVVAGDVSLLERTAAALGSPLRILDYDASRPAAAHRGGTMTVLHVPTAHPVTAGGLDVRNAAYVVELLDRACDGCMNGEFAAMVTAPVQKSVIMDAGFEFTGHTEYLAQRTRAALPVDASQAVVVEQQVEL